MSFGKCYTNYFTSTSSFNHWYYVISYYTQLQIISWFYNLQKKKKKE